MYIHTHTHICTYVYTYIYMDMFYSTPCVCCRMQHPNLFGYYVMSDYPPHSKGPKKDKNSDASGCVKSVHWCDA